MPLSLYVDGPRWRGRAETLIAQASPTILVPVAKGNGYGFGIATLARETSRLGLTTIAVGEYEEIKAVSKVDSFDVLVLSPWRPWVDVTGDERIVHTVSRLDDLQKLSAGDRRPRVVLELLTSMRRHGLTTHELSEARRYLRDVRLEGFALHLPLAGDHRAEAANLARQGLELAAAAGVGHPPLWLSHLSAAEAGPLAADLGVDVRLRVGTNLWLGDRALLQPKATVLDVHDVSRGDPYGYRQRHASKSGFIVVVAGGTAHGIALEAPTPAATMRQRATSLGKGGLEAFGKALSPFRIAGKQRWFAEPPHMQCSMIWLPSDVTPPEVGAEIDVDVRFTTTQFDSVIFND